jgi:predicted phage-related endonuclease
VVEAKTSGIIGPSQTALWGDDGSDEVPDSYLLQVQAQLLVTGAELAYLAALIGGRGFAMFEIRPQSELQAVIAEKASAFIASLASDQAPAEPPQLETLKRLRRQPNKVLPRSDEFDELWLRLDEAKATCKESDNAKDDLQRRLLAMLGDAEAAETRGGLVTYFSQDRKESLVAASTFRVLRFKKGS